MRWFDIWAASVAADVRKSFSILPLAEETPLPRTSAFSTPELYRSADLFAQADPVCFADLRDFQYVYVKDDLVLRLSVS